MVSLQAEWFYVSPCLTIKSLAAALRVHARTHTHTQCFMLISEQTLTTYFYSPDGYVFITKMKCLSARGRAES
jgi:hypothetical protein